MTIVEICKCPECKRGMWCADGNRGEFESGNNVCKLCGQLAWKHWTVKPCRGKL